MKKIALILSLLACWGCSKTRQPIAFGTDGCSFCKMTIVDKTHAAQLITDKGKQRKFDSIECLINDMNNELTKAKLSGIWVANYSKPGEMMGAETATYIVSPKIQSPMGANLSAVDNPLIANDLIEQYEGDGKIYSWIELLDHLKLNESKHWNE